ncbi:MAG: ABC transporter substrate-binding protein [Planctomycetaceae bacterium]|nr:ABC transporter substrate-binding protein [Planctomycetaceae bacterium]
MRLRMLPFEYGIRNLLRRPMRSLLTMIALTLVTTLIYCTIGFLQGLTRMLAVSANPNTAIVFSINMGDNLEYSSIAMSTAGLIQGSVDGISRTHGVTDISPELFLGTQMTIADQSDSFGLLRGVTQQVFQVRHGVQIVEGNWIKPGEILVGRLTAVKLGIDPEQLSLGNELEFEGQQWRIAGIIDSGGGVFDSEIWCRLTDLQQATRRDDLSLVAVSCSNQSGFSAINLFCKRRYDLEIQSMAEQDYFQSLNKDYGPIRKLGWLMVALITASGLFAGLNTMYGAVIGRTREIAMLRTIGFGNKSITSSLIQEGILLGMAGAVLGFLLCRQFVHGVSVRFTMGAFGLVLDGWTVACGCLTGMIVGAFGAFAPTLQALRKDITSGLKHD